ncbi:MAG: head-tail connector protein, partial [Rhodobacterales bacterium]
MMLVEETLVAEAALPVESLKRHLRLGSGFAEDDLQNTLLASFLRAAIAAIEGRTGKVLLRRSFQLLLSEWNSVDRQPFPVAPVVSVAEVSLFRLIEPDTILDPLILVG